MRGSESATLESIRSKLTRLHATLAPADAATPASSMPVEGEATALAGEIVELVRRAQTQKTLFFLTFFFVCQLRSDVRAHELPMAASLSLSSNVSLLQVRVRVALVGL